VTWPLPGGRAGADRAQPVFPVVEVMCPEPASGTGITRPGL